MELCVKNDIWIWYCEIIYMYILQVCLIYNKGIWSSAVDKIKKKHLRNVNKFRTVTLKTATKMFDYTAIADRLKTINLSNDSHQTSVIKPVNGIQFYP